MYGDMDVQLVRAIATIMNKGRDHTVDPTLFSLAHKLQQERLEEAARHQSYPSEPRVNPLHRLGGLLVTLGHKMQANGIDAPCEDAYANEVCA
jgi:hypothetical protein